MSKSYSNDEIQEIASTIHSLSKEYYLSHTVDASVLYLKKEVEKIYKDKLLKLETKIKQCDDLDMFDNVVEEKEKLEAKMRNERFHLFVDYIDLSTNNARTVKINNGFEITLPKSLKDKGKKEDIDKLRELLAHELGHIVLHTIELVKDSTTNGTNHIKDNNKEEEANLFAKMIINLKSEYYKEICKDKTLINE